jgi:hypothetical protein
MINVSKTSLLWSSALVGLDGRSSTKEIYKLARRPQVLPYPDSMEVSTQLAEELYETGKNVVNIRPYDAPLPIFELTMYIGSDAVDTNIAKMLQPKHPYRDDMWIYGFSALFVADAPSVDPRCSANAITCLLTLHDCNDSSAGSNEVALFSIYDLDKHGFTLDAWYVSESADWLCDLDGLDALAHWLGYAWRGIQNRLTNRPELVRERHVRFAKENINHAKQQVHGRKHIVKYQRVITLYPEPDALTTPPASSVKHEFALSCWGVIGHWRTCKSGKTIWVRSYYKGKERNIPIQYSTKEYEIMKGGLPDA